MEQFTIEELKNIAALINIAPIKGGESMTVALLLQKINILLQKNSAEPETKDTPK